MSETSCTVPSSSNDKRSISRRIVDSMSRPGLWRVSDLPSSGIYAKLEYNLNSDDEVALYYCSPFTVKVYGREDIRLSFWDGIRAYWILSRIRNAKNKVIANKSCDEYRNLLDRIGI